VIGLHAVPATTDQEAAQQKEAWSSTDAIRG